LKYGKESAERAIAKMLDRGYIDDESFCKEYARYLFEVKKYDIKRISYELRLKGVDVEIADNTLKTLDNEPILRIIEMLRTKYYNKTNSEKELKKLINRFVRMGYSYSDIRSAFDECELEMPKQ
jgi:SOS response regulatory protein OraA/RecX